MKDERIIEEMARLDGYAVGGVIFKELRDGKEILTSWHQDKRGGGHIIPNYLTDHNACQRVIDGMDATTMQRYVHELHLICDANQVRSLSEFIHFCILKATPRQKCIAILRAYGKWEES